MNSLFWDNVQGQQSHKYTCGYCGRPLASEKGWQATRNEQQRGGYVTVQKGSIYICHNCCRPTFFDYDTGKQTPGIPFGEPVNNISDKPLLDIYEEARLATSAGCYTAAVLCCRKLLMHLAVAKGAKEGDSFKSYVEHLAAKNHIPADCKPWVEQIKDIGNEANHEVKMMKKEDAENLVLFCEMLLKILFEYPATARARIPNKIPELAAA
jgi:hypothetical protein